MDYSEWPSRKMRITNLWLDPQNPRIPGATGTIPQHELIAELIRHDDVYGLARSIADNGYFPNDSIVIFLSEDDGHHYVIEGNRRVAALKVLLSPEAAPDDEQKKFSRLALKVNKRSITHVRVSIAPSRAAAFPLIVDRHTHTQVAKWSPAMQARFFRLLAEDGYSAEEISGITRATVAKVNESLRTDVLYRVACSLELESSIKEKVANPRTFPFSTFERALEFKVVREFLGLQPDPAQIFKGKVSRGEFLKGFRRLVTDVATGKVDSRKIHDNKSVEKYLSTFGDDRPDLKKRGRFSIGELTEGSKSVSEELPQSRTRPRRSRDSGTMITTGLRCRVDSDRIGAIFTELRGLRIEKHPNASAVLYRTFLDLCVTHYLEKAGYMRSMLARYQGGKHNRKKDWSPTLRQQLTYLLDEVDIGIEGQPLAALKRFSQDRSETLCLDTLDKFAHNKYTPPTSQDLLAIRTTTLPLLRILLEEPV